MWRFVLGVLVASFALLATPSASAHDEIVGSTPSNGAQVESAPAEIEIRFSKGASLSSGEGIITGPDGAEWNSGPARVGKESLVLPMRPTTVAGRYTVDIRVVSTDGHPVTGTITFELMPSTTSNSTAVPGTDSTPTASVAPSAAGKPVDDAPGWPWIVGSTLVAVGVIALLRKVSRSTDE